MGANSLTLLDSNVSLGILNLPVVTVGFVSRLERPNWRAPKYLKHETPRQPARGGCVGQHQWVHSEPNPSNSLSEHY